MTTATNAIAKDERLPFESMAIVEKYEAFLNYAYPKIQNCPRKDGVFRDAVLRVCADVVEELYAAGKSRQVSRLYILDARVATIRFWLRFFSSAGHRVLNPHQHQVALGHLNEVGAMLGAWIKKLQDGDPKRSAEGRSVGKQESAGGRGGEGTIPNPRGQRSRG